jgi:hypothetical protein
MKSRIRTALIAAAALAVAIVVAPSAQASPGGRAAPSAPLIRPAAEAIAASRYAFTPSGIDGGGTTSTVATDPFSPTTLLAGQDTSGLWRSTDAGATWSPVDVPEVGERDLFSDPIATHVAAISFSDSTSGLVYAALGNPGSSGTQTGGGVARSVDGGLHWAMVSPVDAQPQFAGGGTTDSDELYALPRSVGNLLAIDGSGTVYTGSYHGGLWRSDGPPSPSNDSWDRICQGEISDFIRAVVRVPSSGNGTELLVSQITSGPHPGGVVRITHAESPSPSCTPISSATTAGTPATVEDLAVAGTTVWAAGGPDGVWSWTATGGWTSRFRPAPASTDTSWSAITVAGGTVYAGATKPPLDGSGDYDTVVRGTNSGGTWNWTNIVHDVGGTVVGRTSPWWHSAAGTNNHPGESSGYAAHLAIGGNGALYLTGRAGVWRTLNPTAANPHWDPATRQLNATFSFGIAIDPADPQQVLLGDTDWSLFSSTDGMTTVHQSRPDPDAYLTVNDVAYDDGGRAYIATEFLLKKLQGGGSEAHGGEVFSSDTATSTSPSWQPLGLPAVVAGRGCVPADVVGVALVHGSPHGALVAGVPGCGVFRWDGTAWDTDPVGPLSAAVKSKRMSFISAPGTNHLYYYDRSVGVYESLNGGHTFHQVADLSAAQYVETDGFDTTNYLGIAGNYPDVVYASTAAGLFALAGVGSGGAMVTPQSVTGVSHPGPLTAAGGLLYVTTVAQRSAPSGARTNISGLFTTPLDPATGLPGTFTDISDRVYRAMGQLPHDIEVNTTGTIYVSMRSSGLVIGRPQ